MNAALHSRKAATRRTLSPARGLLTAINQRHWEDVYSRKAANEVSWFQPHLERCLQFVDQAKLTADAAIVDVGGGASTFVDDRLDRGFSVDLRPVLWRSPGHGSETAGRRCSGGRRHHDARAAGAPIRLLARPRGLPLPRRSAPTGPLRRPGAKEPRARRPHRRVATFSPDGPTRCSGLDVTQDSEGAIHAVFGPDFAPIDCARETHHTPSGASQEVLDCECRLLPDAAT